MSCNRYNPLMLRSLLDKIRACKLKILVFGPSLITPGTTVTDPLQSKRLAICKQIDALGHEAHMPENLVDTKPGSVLGNPVLQEMLYGDYAVSISPINCKLHAVAGYLLWERYPDIQLTFPLPIKYLPERFSKGIGQTFYMQLPTAPNLNGILRTQADRT